MRCDHILVDGWNVIHAEPTLKKLLLADARAAQRKLAEMLEPIHDVYATRITIVYDGRGEDVSIERPNDAVITFSEVYTPSNMTADEFIERYCALAKNRARIIVISNDNMIWETVSVLGAVCMRIGEIVSSAQSAAGHIRTVASRINLKTDIQWKNFGALANMDLSGLEIAATNSTLFDSKRMKKRMSKMAKSKSRSDGASETADDRAKAERATDGAGGEESQSAASLRRAASQFSPASATPPDSSEISAEKRGMRTAEKSAEETDFAEKSSDSARLQSVDKNSNLRVRGGGLPASSSSEPAPYEAGGRWTKMDKPPKPTEQNGAGISPQNKSAQSASKTAKTSKSARRDYSWEAKKIKPQKPTQKQPELPKKVPHIFKDFKALSFKPASQHSKKK